MYCAVLNAVNNIVCFPFNNNVNSINKIIYSRHVIYRNCAFYFFDEKIYISYQKPTNKKKYIYIYLRL